MSIKVVIIEDQKELREMLGVLINGSAGFQCVAQFEDAEEAILQMTELNTDVALVDIHLPGQSGISLVRILKDKIPNVKFMICSSLEDDENIFNALKAGADGYISKSSSPVKILEAIQDVFNGGSPMSSQIARRVVSFFNPKKEMNT